MPAHATPAMHTSCRKASDARQFTRRIIRSAHLGLVAPMIINPRKDDQYDRKPQSERQAAERRREQRARDRSRRRAEHHCPIHAKRAGVAGAELREPLVVMRSMALPPALTSGDAP